MTELLENLLVLQDRDQKVSQITKELARIPVEIERIEDQMADRTEAFEKQRTTTRQIEADRRKLELEVKSKETVIVRYKSQQQSTRKNEEFAALNHEIAHIQGEITRLEDEELVLMEKYEVAQASLKKAEITFKEEQDSSTKKRADLVARQAFLQNSLIEAKQRKAEAESKIEPDMLGRYQRLYKSKGEAVIVPARHQVCSGCHMKLTTQTWVSAKKGDGLVTCENCSRLLFSDE